MAPKVTPELLQDLSNDLGPDVEIVVDKNNSRFKELSKRWTDIDRKTPGAIVLPDSPSLIQKTVRWAHRSSVPFVAKSGGHSQWSTVGEHGIVIDLSKYSAISVDANAKKATLEGSILSKDVAVALAAKGFFTALGNGNTVGAIPYFLGGGASITTSITGYGSDQILAARMVDATGNIINVTEEDEPDLLYAIRGAGQFFGLVFELTIRVTPLAELGNNQGVIWAGAFIFPLDRAPEVARVMNVVVNDSNHATAGLMMVQAPPPTRDHALVIAARYTGNPDDAKTAYKALYDLGPLVAKGGPVPIQNASDGREALQVKGDFKKFGVVGLRRFDIDGFLGTIDVWKTLVTECPDAINTSFNFQWDSRPAKLPGFESAMSLHDIRFWQNNLIWHTEVRNRERVDELNDQSIALMRGTDASEFADFQNGTRTGPIAWRFRGPGKLEKLKALKRRWDPKGVFTSQLLDE
ncbi:hypothetical protein GGR51DRAFT_528291 [Nemania sp. FL0031]|nr:hypothetical protein GGR51DRAFT_528291 [Nemania sp. FL0031]